MNNPEARPARWAWALLCGWVTLTAAACGRQSHDLRESSDPNGPVVLRIVDAEGFEKILDKNHGKVVLVDFWATWCIPCVEQFPHTVSMERKHRDRGLAVVTVSLDDPEAQELVHAFLERNDAHCQNLLSEYGAGTKALKAFGLPGPIPCYRVYDRAGELRHEFSVDPSAQQQFIPADIEAAIGDLL